MLLLTHHTQEDTMEHRITSRGIWALAALAFTALPAASQEAAIAPARAPSLNPNGTLGLSQVISADGIGESTVNLTARGTLYNQERANINTPPEGTQVSTATLGVALGLNRYLDAFTGVNVYNLRNAGAASGSGCNGRSPCARRAS